MQLLVRGARGVELTPAGSALLLHARRLLGQADELRAELSDYTKGGKGVVRIHANASALGSWVHRHHPFATPQWIEISAEHVGEKYLSWATTNSSTPPL